MGAIAFSQEPEHIWVVAGWVLRQVLDDIASHHPEDSKMAMEFEGAKAIDGLMVYLLPPDLSTRVTAAIEEVATGILSGVIHSGIAERHHWDERTVAQYKSALRELLEAVPHPPQTAFLSEIAFSSSIFRIYLLLAYSARRENENGQLHRHRDWSASRRASSPGACPLSRGSRLFSCLDVTVFQSCWTW